MRNYLDLVYLAVTQEAWHNRIYSDIFASLNTILEYLANIEEKTNTRYQLVKFKMTEELFAQIYSNNPFKNELLIIIYFCLKTIIHHSSFIS